jgi:hypothetical protein
MPFHHDSRRCLQHSHPHHQRTAQLLHHSCHPPALRTAQRVQITHRRHPICTQAQLLHHIVPHPRATPQRLPITARRARTSLAAKYHRVQERLQPAQSTAPVHQTGAPQVLNTLVMSRLRNTLRHHLRTHLLLPNFHLRESPSSPPLHHILYLSILIYIRSPRGN